MAIIIYPLLAVAFAGLIFWGARRIMRKIDEIEGP
jgi:nitrate reductase NapE component